MADSCCAPSAPARGSSAVAEVTTTRPGSTDGMVELAGGEFLMGNAGPHSYPEDGEGPVSRVRLDAFWIDQHGWNRAIDRRSKGDALAGRLAPERFEGFLHERSD